MKRLEIASGLRELIQLVADKEMGFDRIGVEHLVQIECLLMMEAGLLWVILIVCFLAHIVLEALVVLDMLKELVG